MTPWFLSVPCPVSNLELVKSEVKGWKPLSVNPLREVSRSEPKPPRQVTLNHQVSTSHLSDKLESEAWKMGDYKLQLFLENRVSVKFQVFALPSFEVTNILVGIYRPLIEDTHV